MASTPAIVIILVVLALVIALLVTLFIMVIKGSGTQNCVLDSDCTADSTKPYCADSKCVACKKDGDCGPQSSCLKNKCLQCKLNTDCSGVTPLCTTAGKCVQCIKNEDCVQPELCKSNVCKITQGGDCQTNVSNPDGGRCPNDRVCLAGYCPTLKDEDSVWSGKLNDGIDCKFHVYSQSAIGTYIECTDASLNFNKCGDSLKLFNNSTEDSVEACEQHCRVRNSGNPYVFSFYDKNPPKDQQNCTCYNFKDTSFSYDVPFNKDCLGVDTKNKPVTYFDLITTT